MFNSQTNTATPSAPAPPKNNNFLNVMKQAAATTKAAAKTTVVASKAAAESVRKGYSGVSSVVKQATSSVSETKSLKSQSKIDSSFDLKSPDSENYKFNVKESDVKPGKGVDPKLFYCLVNISCDNAKKLKQKLQSHICQANQDHSQIEALINQMKETLNQINNLGNGKYSLEFKNVVKEVTKVSQKVDDIRLKERMKEIILEGDQQLPVYITIKGYTDLNEAKIIKILPRDGKFAISYTDAAGKSQILSGIEFSKLCVGSGEGLNVKEPSKGCELPDVECALKGGKRKTSKKSKKSRKMVGGGDNDLESISTNSLC